MRKSQQGIVHVFVIIFVIALAAIGGVGYFVFSKSQSVQESKKSQKSDKKYPDERVSNDVINDLKGTEFDQ